MDFRKTVQCNFDNVQLAIEQGLRPMQRLFDRANDDLPFFGNVVSGGPAGNSHSPTFSAAHIPGRWLNALLNAEALLPIELDESAIYKLKKWAFKAFDWDAGFYPCLDLETYEPRKEFDLHNLRETMHSFYALYAYRGDGRALKAAEKMIDSVDRFFDFGNCRFREDLFTRETGGVLIDKWLPQTVFPITFGRYIGPLVKLYRASGLEKALSQAIRLKNCALSHVINELGDYDVEKFGVHTHSTTAMLSSLAQLAEITQDQGLFARLIMFMNNGLKKIALDFGWCVENYERRDLIGEINNTSDIMETCLILGSQGYLNYYAQAERILRSHFLPSQLLDTHFIPDEDHPDEPGLHRLASQARGAFGFPCPYGHEYEPGARISFNWDITGGGVGGLCEAYRHTVTKRDGIVSVNLLFDHETDDVEIRSPYENGDRLSVVRKTDAVVRVRMPDNVDRQKLAERLSHGGSFLKSDGWLYLTGGRPGETMTVNLPLKDTRTEYRFRDHVISVLFHGERAIKVSSTGKRLCFFENFEEE